MNDHRIHGRLVRDPELTQGSEPKKDRVNFTVAVDRRFGDETDFFDCVMFGSRAGVIKKYFFKGSEIVCWGEGQLRRYEGRDGVKRTAYSIKLEDFDFCGSKSDNRSNDTATEQNEPQTADLGDSWEEQEGDIPF